MKANLNFDFFFSIVSDFGTIKVSESKFLSGGGKAALYENSETHFFYVVQFDENSEENKSENFDYFPKKVEALEFYNSL